VPTVNTKHVFMGLYGAPGVGKTRLVGTSAEIGQTMIIRPPTDHTDSILLKDKSGIEERISRDWGDMYDLIDELRMAPLGKWAWVWLDSISGWQDFGLDDLFESAVARKPARKEYGPDQGEYGINMFRIGAWFRHLVGPDTFNFGFTAWTANLPSPDLDEDGDPTAKLMPWVQGKQMSSKLCGYMNLVCYLDQLKSGTRILRSQSTEAFYAKDQFDAFGEKGTMTNPTMPKIMDAISNSPGRKKATGGKKTTKRTAQKPRRKIARRG
jgi:hypothetical protein